MLSDSPKDSSPVITAFGSGQAVPKPKKNRPYLTYKILCTLMLVPPLLMIAFFAFISLFDGSGGKTMEQQHAEKSLTLLLLLPTMSLMIMWNFAAIPFFFYSALTLSRAAKPKISISTILLCITAMAVIPAMFIISILNNGDGELGVMDVLLAPYSFTTDVIFN